MLILLTDRLFGYLLSPKAEAPAAGPMIVERSDPLRRGFSGPPTREGSLLAFSLLNVLHSDPTSITLKVIKSIISL